jgi:hypothetical protein
MKEVASHFASAIIDMIILTAVLNAPVKRGSTGGLYTDSCIVRPAMLADGVGGKGRESCLQILSSAHIRLSSSASVDP